MARWKFILGRTLKGFGQDHCSSFAAAVAYFALLSIFPLAVFAVSLAGYFMRDPGSQERVINALMEFLPLSEGSGRAELSESIRTVAEGRGGLGLIGLLGAAWSGSALFSALRTGLNMVFRVERDRPFLQAKLMDLGMVLGLGALLLASFVLTAVLAIMRRVSDDIFGDSSLFVTLAFNILRFALPAVISLAIFVLLYRIVPHAEVSWREALPGAVLAAVALEALKLGFAQYVSHFGNYNAVYGTLGFVIIFLFFAYLAGQITLLGAEFTRAYVEVTSGAVPALQPALPKKRVSATDKAQEVVKGLFVAPEPHHDHRLPYEPARNGGAHTDRQAEQRQN